MPARESPGMSGSDPRHHETTPDPAAEAPTISEERMRRAIEATDLAVWDYNLETGIVHLSDSWSWMLGGARQPTDATTDELVQLIPEQDRPMVREAVRRALSGDASPEYRMTHRVLRPDGHLMWVHSTGRVVQRAPDGKPLRMVGVYRDVTENKLLGLELAAREARYRAVIETSMDGFWITDPTGRLIEVNDVYVRQSGYSREELLGMHIADLDALDDPQEVISHREKIKVLGHDRFESLHRRKDGSIWPVELSVTYWPKLDLAFTFIVDCSERKRAERQIMEDRQALESLHQSQVAAQTAAALAHELNQPLGAIASYSDAALIMLEAGSTDPAMLREAVEKIREQALRAGDAIREMLKLIGTGAVSSDTLDLNDEIRHALGIAKTEVKLKFRTLLQLEKDLPAVRASRIHVQKVLLNLLHNAVESMQEAGRPNPEIVIEVRTRRDVGMAQVTLKDNGPGIRSEDAARLFQPFFTTKGNGIGMGLAISRSLIEANGGQLWCDPKEGPGAVFHLTLPFAS